MATVTPQQKVARVRSLCTVLFLGTAFAVFWNSHFVDTLLLGINATMWSIMATEAHAQIRADRRTPTAIH